MCGSWWSGEECGDEGEGGGGELLEQAGLKRGCSNVPTHSIHPLLICRSLGHFGGAKQRMQKELRTLSRHTAIELKLHLEHTK